jgi:hypothetical protein
MVTDRRRTIMLYSFSFVHNQGSEEIIENYIEMMTHISVG